MGKNELIALEAKYGGISTGVERRKVSPKDPRRELPSNGMQGGDRMAHHGYAKAYAKYLPKTASLVVEMGILKGQGLAVLSELYPEARLIGLDIDTSHFHENREYLTSRGAFAKRDPEIIEFDQLGEWELPIEPGTVDVWIDDALHDDASVIQSARKAMRYMAKDGVYFIEDNNSVAPRIAKLIPERFVYSIGYLTVLV